MLFDLKKANVLITGGSDGIGLGLATRFLAAGSSVLVTGRTKAKLDKASQDHPGLITFQNDISKPDQREKLAKYVLNHFSNINIIINNAGIQRPVPLAQDNSPWSESQNEIDTLVSAPVHLNHLLIPLLLKKNQPSLIVNVSSGLVFIPPVFAPLYGACKAAIHSYTISLRESLKNTTVKVVELIPPAVQTNIGGPHPSGAPLNDFCDSVFPRILAPGAVEVGYDFTESLTKEYTKAQLDSLFQNLSSQSQVPLYKNS
jgi:uncharacterized oxidoreductase